MQVHFQEKWFIPSRLGKHHREITAGTSESKDGSMTHNANLIKITHDAKCLLSDYEINNKYTFKN